MARTNLTLLEKITQSENKIKQLIDQRNKELLDIIARSNAITIDNNLLSGFLAFALNPSNKDHPILKEFMSSGRSTKTPSKTKQSNSNTNKSSN